MVDMKKRTISALVLLVILISSLIVSSKVFAFVMAICAVIGFNEFFNIKGDDKSLIIVKIFSIISVLLLVLNNVLYKVDLCVLILFPLLLLTIPIIFYDDSKKYNILDSLYLLGGVYLIGFAFGYIAYLREVSLASCIYIFIISFVTDTYAYIGGSLVGKYTFTPISPKKTIEGSLIGMLMGVVVGSVYYYNVIGNESVMYAVLLSFSLAIISEIGDLLFSSIKRYYGVKDFSNLIPGHGGILDRFDSVIYVSLCMALITSLF